MPASGFNKSFAGVLLVLICCGSPLSARNFQEPVPVSENLIEVLSIYDLPLQITGASINKTKKGNRLKLSFTNTAAEQILGMRYWLLVIDPAYRIRASVDHSENLKLEASAANTLSFPAPARLKIYPDDRVFIVVAQVIGKQSIWEVQDARNVLVSYAKGKGFTMPKVLHMLNQVDSPIGLTPNLLKPKK